MKKVLLILSLFLIGFSACQKYESTIPNIPDPPTPIPDTTFIPDNSWVGNGPFFAKADGNTLLLLFNNVYVLSPPVDIPFCQYKIGSGSWSPKVTQATPFQNHEGWGLGTIPMSVIIPENAVIHIRFGIGSAYADIQTSMFYLNGELCFMMAQINH